MLKMGVLQDQLIGKTHCVGFWTKTIGLELEQGQEEWKQNSNLPVTAPGEHMQTLSTPFTVAICIPVLIISDSQHIKMYKV